ncbi:MAG: hypothetical protein QM706_01245 [Nitrospira sp.]
MRGLLAGVLVVLFCSAANAQNFQFELPEQTLNELVNDLGHPGAGEVYLPVGLITNLGYGKCRSIGTLECTYGTSNNTSGTSAPVAAGNKVVALSLCQGPDGQPAVLPTPEPIPWQWWITEAHFTIGSQQLNFSANVRYRIGSKWYSVAQTVPATLTFDSAQQRLRMAISTFKVPIRYSDGGVVEVLGEVDVGRFMSFTIPTSRQKISVPDLNGSVRTITTRVDNVTVQYVPGKVLVKVDAGFN